MDHSVVLEKLCRVCGKSIVTKSGKSKHPCRDYLDELHRVFGVSAHSDDPTTHPMYFCHSCKLVLHKSTKMYQHRTVIFEGWCGHEEDSCTVCEHYNKIQRGGRPRKVTSTLGRPADISPRYCVDHIHNISPPALIPANETVTACTRHCTSVANFKCPICCETLRQPIELVTCGYIVCAECLCGWLQCQDSLACPCCYSDHLRDYSTIKAAPSLVISSIGSLCVICHKCNQHVQLNLYSDHSCKPLGMQVSPQTSVDDVLQQPTTAPLTAIEVKLQTSLARRSLGSSTENVLQLKTGGKVSKTIRIKKWIK